MKTKINKEDGRGRKPFEETHAIAVDWELPNNRIAKQLHVSPLTVAHIRERMHIKPLGRGRPHEEMDTNRIEKYRKQVEQLKKKLQRFRD